MVPRPPQHAASSRPWPTAALLLLCAILYLPGLLALPPVDRDEARFAQATRQMIDSGDLINIRFQDEPRDKKPVGIYWAQAACIKVVQPFVGADAIWPYRLPSIFGAALAVWLLYFFLRSVVGEGPAALSGALLASSLLLVVEAHLATTDALLLATIVAAQGALLHRLLRPDDHALGYSLLFWIAQGLGLLIKGPIAPLISIMTLVAWRLTGSRFRPLTLLHAWIGLPITGLITLPWVIAVSRETGGSFLVNAIAGDLFPKLVSGQESHGFPPGFYLLLVTLTFWPASLLTGPAVIRAWRHKGDPLTRFLLAWLVPTWILLELIPTKLPHYVLPLYPALAAITAIAAANWSSQWHSQRHDGPSRRSLTIGWSIWSIITLTIAGAIVALPLALDEQFEPWTLAPALGALAAVATGSMLARRLDAAPAILASLALCSALVAAPSLGLVLPRIEALWPSRAIARIVEPHQTDSKLPWAAVGFHEPSLVFALGTETKVLGPNRAAESLAAGQVAGVILQHEQRDAFELRARELDLAVHRVGDVHALNISKGAWIDVSIYVVDAIHADAP